MSDPCMRPGMRPRSCLRGLAARGLRRGRRRRGRQRGQALIEFTLFFTFMMLLLAGVTDIAFMLDAHVNVVYAARQGARTGAALGQGNLDPNNKINPDCAILGAVHATLVGQSDVTVTGITIFKADPTTGQPATDGSNQEHFVGTAACPSGPGLQTPSPAPTGSWPATSRNITEFSEDQLGVKIDYQFQFRFNLWQGGTLNLSDLVAYPMNVQIA
jgi:Flp pilus assembly protein TadG